MDAIAFALVDSSHRSSISHFLCFISEGDNVERSPLKVDQALLHADRLLIARFRGLIRPVSLFLHLGDLIESLRPSLFRISDCASSLTLLCNGLIVHSLAI